MQHPPLSQSLARMLETHSTAAGVTLNQLLEHTEGRGLYLAMVLLSLPFVIPVSIPGLSNVLGLIILILAVRLALELPPRLPKFIGAHTLPPWLQEKMLRGSVKLLRLIEKGVRPRRTDWLTWRAARSGNALLLAFMALLLALPIPPLIPFTNSLPAYAIILTAVSMMEEDGVMIWIGYAAAVLAVAYFALMGGVIWTIFHKYYHSFIRFFTQ